jgi:hypothetical protein
MLRSAARLVKASVPKQNLGMHDASQFLPRTPAQRFADSYIAGAKAREARLQAAGIPMEPRGPGAEAMKRAEANRQLLYTISATHGAAIAESMGTSLPDFC